MLKTLEQLFGVTGYKSTMQQIKNLRKKLGLTLPDELKTLYSVVDEGHVNDVCCYAVRVS